MIVECFVKLKSVVQFAVLAYPENGNLKEQRVCQFFFKLGKNATETFKMLKVAFGE
jgi:hypothetical protein